MKDDSEDYGIMCWFSMLIATLLFVGGEWIHNKLKKYVAKQDRNNWGRK